MQHLWHIVGALALLQSMTPTMASAVEPIYVYASQRGEPTLDQGEGGGNPFASALVDLMARDSLTFETFRTELVSLTSRKSGGFQRPDVPPSADLAAWQFLPKSPAERRIALVVVFSDYSASDAVKSLPGAKHDMHRVATAFSRAGFEVHTALDPDRQQLDLAMRNFADRSSRAEVAALYTTGHGVEVDGIVYLLPGDFQLSQGKAALKDRAVRLTTLGAALQASRANFAFYGGCRDNPFGTR